MSSVWFSSGLPGASWHYRPPSGLILPHGLVWDVGPPVRRQKVEYRYYEYVWDSEPAPVAFGEVGVVGRFWDAL